MGKKTDLFVGEDLKKDTIEFSRQHFISLVAHVDSNGRVQYILELACGKYTETYYLSRTSYEKLSEKLTIYKMYSKTGDINVVWPIKVDTYHTLSGIVTGKGYKKVKPKPKPKPKTKK